MNNPSPPATLQSASMLPGQSGISLNYATGVQTQQVFRNNSATTNFNTAVSLNQNNAANYSSHFPITPQNYAQHAQQNHSSTSLGAQLSPVDFEVMRGTRQHHHTSSGVAGMIDDSSSMICSASVAGAEGLDEFGQAKASSASCHQGIPANDITNKSPNCAQNLLSMQHYENDAISSKGGVPNASLIATHPSGTGDAVENEQQRMLSKAKPFSLNQMGGSYTNGKPLPLVLRQRIILMASRGFKASEISKEIKVSHGCISKIVARYNSTGSIMPGVIGGSKPKVATENVIKSIVDIKSATPTIFAWEIRDKLVEMGVCTEKNVPSVSSINRVIRQKTTLPITGQSQQVQAVNNSMDSRLPLSHQTQNGQHYVRSSQNGAGTMQNSAGYMMHSQSPHHHGSHGQPMKQTKQDQLKYNMMGIQNHQQAMNYHNKETTANLMSMSMNRGKIGSHDHLVNHHQQHHAANFQPQYPAPLPKSDIYSSPAPHASPVMAQLPNFDLNKQISMGQQCIQNGYIRSSNSSTPITTSNASTASGMRMSPPSQQMQQNFHHHHHQIPPMHHNIHINSYYTIGDPKLQNQAISPSTVAPAPQSVTVQQQQPQTPQMCQNAAMAATPQQIYSVPANTVQQITPPASISSNCCRNDDSPNSAASATPINSSINSGGNGKILDDCVSVMSQTNGTAA